MGKNAKGVIRRLGYLDKASLYHWIKEYERDCSLHERRVS